MIAKILSPRVLIIGGGPSGLRAAAKLAPRLEGEVLVVERENTAGGIPRHSNHPGYGIRDMGKFINGPSYAKILREQATRAGATIMVNTMVTDWAGELAVHATAPTGRLKIEPEAIILATGARERPRSARMIPGDRGQGVYTTGNLQTLVHLKHGKVGKIAVVVGSELVSWSAALTLRHAGCRTVLMTTENPKPEAYFLLNQLGKIFFKTKVATRTKVTKIIGTPTVTAVEVEHLDTGDRNLVECDTVILTGSWIPDNELARAAGVPIDAVSKAPIVDETLRTMRPGLFAIGNLLHPVDTADVAAIDGAVVAEHVLEYLSGNSQPRTAVKIIAEEPLRWVAPAQVNLNGTDPPRRRLLFWTDRFVAFPRVSLKQCGQIVAQKRLWWPAAPGRVFRVPSVILRGLDHRRGTITVTIEI